MHPVLAMFVTRSTWLRVGSLQEYLGEQHIIITVFRDVEVAKRPGDLWRLAIVDVRVPNALEWALRLAINPEMYVILLVPQVIESSRKNLAYVLLKRRTSVEVIARRIVECTYSGLLKNQK